MVRANLNKLEVTKIFANLVKNYPVQSKNYLRPQTFANVKYREDIFKTSLDKNSIYDTVVNNQGLFYSRAWEADNNNINKIPFDFPLAFLLELEDLQSDHLRPTYKFLFGVLDLAERDKSTDTRVEEIKRNDIDMVARSILNESLDYVYAQKDGAGAHAWQSVKELESLKAAGTITSYLSRAYFKTAFKNQNRLVVKPFEDMEKRKRLNGVMCEIEIQGDLTLVDYNY